MEGWQENYTGTRIHHRMLEPSKSRNIPQRSLSGELKPIVYLRFDMLSCTSFQRSGNVWFKTLKWWYRFASWRGTYNAENIWPSDVRWIQLPEARRSSKIQYTLAISYCTWIFFIYTRRTDDSFAEKSRIPRFSYVSFKRWVEHLLCTCMQSDT